jgi:crotonobetainyl-CoA:carnitine CoA-transferase CaiB-like acyl-CoA transferase
MNLAFGIASALFRRERTGEPSVVDVSLLATAMWMLSSDLISSHVVGADPDRGRSRRAAFNPITNTYETKDRRWISLVMLESDRFWPDLCRHLGRIELIDDPRFLNAAARAEHAVECIAELDRTFATASLNEWKERFQTLAGSWAPQQSPLEVMSDPQVIANRLTTELVADDGLPFSLIATPVQFDERPPTSTRAPEFAANTEEILLEAGIDWGRIAELKDSGIIT